MQLEQLDLLNRPKPEMLNGCAWCRRPKLCTQGAVLAVPVPMPLGFVHWLKEQGYKVVETACDRGQVAVLLFGDTDDLLRWLPAPAGHGSYTAGNYLPW